jgi:fucose permease
LVGAFAGAVLLAWNPSSASNAVAIVLIGFSIAPIFPALMSGTSRRVGAHFAANTIGLQMAATGLGAAAIPSLLGVLARQSSLEIIPICMVAIFSALFGLYILAVRASPGRSQAEEVRRQENPAA